MTKSSQGAAPEGRGSPGYETRDVSTRVIWWTGAGLTILVLGASAAMLLLFDILEEREASRQPEIPALARSAGDQPPEPRLQALPRQDLDEVMAEQRRLLTTYGWVDREAGIARIPIERSMEIIATQGVPPRKPPASSEQQP